MKEAIIIPVMHPNDENEHELKIEHEDNILFFILDNKPLFNGDFNGNFKDAFDRAIGLWGE